MKIKRTMLCMIECCMILLLTCICTTALAGDGFKDPLVKISMPPSDVDVPHLLKNLSKDLSKASGVPESGITVIFNTIPANHMITGGKLAEKYNDKDHPVVVEVDLAGFFDEKQVEICMASIADSLSKHNNISRRQVFILTTQEKSGMVYVLGETMKWKKGKNPFVETDKFKK
jgi:phenylpyruvate tautomerase PptA (4-oxalocrotonate tautomerase family)